MSRRTCDRPGGASRRQAYFSLPFTYRMAVRSPPTRKGLSMARKYDPERLKKAAADWDIHHALVAAVRRLVKLAGGVQEAKDVIDAIAAADALEDDKEEGK